MAWEINRQRIIWILVIVAANLLFDQWTKQLAHDYLMGKPPVSYLGDIFRLYYVENKGAFLSMGAGQSELIRYWGLKILPVILLSGLFIYTLFSSNMNRRQYVAFSFIIGGGISNIIDRLLYNQVGDFMNMGIGSLRTGIFNFADVSIMIGLAIMIPEFFQKKANQNASEEPTPADS
ncbi:MAG: signal peptidase II [Chitinophagales bacterium]|nr:signal peptidase II [Chitinophagales bacterium]